MKRVWGILFLILLINATSLLTRLCVEEESVIESPVSYIDEHNPLQSTLESRPDYAVVPHFENFATSANNISNCEKSTSKTTKHYYDKYHISKLRNTLYINTNASQQIERHHRAEGRAVDHYVYALRRIVI